MAIFKTVVDGKLVPCDKKLIVYGNGPHARVVYGYLFDECVISGVIVDDHVLSCQPQIGDHGVVALSQAIDRYPPSEYSVLVALGFRDFNGLRHNRSCALRGLGYELVGFIDRSVRLPRNFSVEGNSIIVDHVAINDGVVVEEGVFAGSGAMLGHDSVLRAYSWVGSGVALAGGVVVGGYSILGMNCSVKQGTVLAHHTLITPNTFVNMNTAPYATIASETGKHLPHDSRTVMRFAYVSRRT